MGGLLPEDAAREIYGAPDAVAGALRPTGRARPVVAALSSTAGGRSPAASATRRGGTPAALSYATAAVDLMYAEARGAAIYTRNLLERCFRDIHTVTQHVSMNPGNYEVSGRVLFGLDPDPSAFCKLVGRENVIAGADCGFSSEALHRTEIHPTVVWEKFKAMREGADLASKQLSLRPPPEESRSKGD